MTNTKSKRRAFVAMAEKNGDIYEIGVADMYFPAELMCEYDKDRLSEHDRKITEHSIYVYDFESEAGVPLAEAYAEALLNDTAELMNIIEYK